MHLFKKYNTGQDSPTLLKQKEIFNKIINERRDKILELSEKINYDDLTYHFKVSNIREKSFNDFDKAFSSFEKIRDGNITLENQLKMK